MGGGGSGQKNRFYGAKLFPINIVLFTIDVCLLCSGLERLPRVGKIYNPLQMKILILDPLLCKYSSNES